jgi:hypothetical protein
MLLAIPYGISSFAKTNWLMIKNVPEKSVKPETGAMFMSTSGVYIMDHRGHWLPVNID